MADIRFMHDNEALKNSHPTLFATLCLVNLQNLKLKDQQVRYLSGKHPDQAIYFLLLFYSTDMQYTYVRFTLFIENGGN